jgi:prolyl 4-hydroxylase
MPIENLERLQLTRYLEGQQYRPHFDWSRTGSRDNERLSTFFAVLEANCTNCGTQFPEMIGNWSDKDARWCEIIECSDPGLSALTMKPKVGSAFYWRNLDSDGSGDERTLHAGLPVLSGSKVGLNIWSRVGPILR